MSDVCMEGMEDRIPFFVYSFWCTILDISSLKILRTYLKYIFHKCTIKRDVLGSIKEVKILENMQNKVTKQKQLTTHSAIALTKKSKQTKLDESWAIKKQKSWKIIYRYDNIKSGLSYGLNVPDVQSSELIKFHCFLPNECRCMYRWHWNVVCPRQPSYNV